MNLRVTIRGLDHKTELRGRAEDRVAATLERFAERIQSVTLFLEDVTGPQKQGFDKRCRVDVRLRRGGGLTIDELATDIDVALAVALDRLKAAISRQIGKKKRGVGAG